MIRIERDPMGMGGRAVHVSAAADLEKLDAKSARLVSPRVRSLFEGFPDAVIALAEDAPVPAMGEWLRSLAEATCTLEVYDTEFFGKGARLRFHYSELWAPSFSAAPPSSPVELPEPLAGVYELLGDIDTQFGCSNRLVPLDQVRTVAELVQRQEVMGFETMEATLREEPSLGSYRAFYDLDGDWLCTAPDGSTTRWLGGEWCDGPVQPARSLREMLDALFASLTRREYFRPDVSAA